MNVLPQWTVPILLILNLAAAGAWWITRRPTVVRLRPAWGTLAAAARLAAHYTAGLRSRLRRPSAAAATAPKAGGLESWIEQVETDESAAASRESGSEHWWRAWAASGGSLPQAAETGRPRDGVERRSA